ncbi:hypothetical protein A3A54_01315 [Candidatus Curtissbacteria bacterium RIFCSPLOWO2_01_FULL_39_62]|uniref:Uncharacterized protein n=2 Tax=Candidatus Curtissiibacteriota TaxID=1752717 RepID=A0A1F5G7S3_9BACT|nr:MAG: hypothetical protein A3D04_01815 [Candidatus Curtissbacteria bacterium RIFCSPHIGHO2_02_FULL_40_16b]OGD90316.1 MAG: hypothetical protein A3E11_01295 [Candidatus Curtissbacteria bacterium RIFCSPHIGHO2_12_FULL_38_37]OGE01976.1 MAG: hypothetical protein A3A54_01315 [Candidatus Curtissbacteria bacterium RIFCSPLOWO2_01_FULL_39_62]OGE12152.1 MAG: hypothetical protein A3G14_01120 [Candidatus Curtissbacteria bacterium RIFCSPLOWO2_12_FULL_38_9]
MELRSLKLLDTRSMTATAHALIGASIALKVTNPLLGIPIAILSHFIADLIPHWDAGTNHKKKSLTRLKMEAAADVLLGFLLAYLIFWKFVDPEYLFVMIIAAQLPDWLEAPSWMFGFKVPPFSWLDWLGHKLQSRMQLPWGLVIQIVVVGLIIYFAFSNSNIFEALAAGI